VTNSPVKTDQYPEENLPGNIEKKFLALIIDDEADICYLLKEILHYKKIEADYVNSLSDAEKFLETREPSLIFLDNKLGDGFGVDHVHEIKSQHPGARIIMMSAYDNASDREKAYMEGADYFISKPFTRNDILKIVSNGE
jgi:DNA-binding response OmpR family regulator